MRTLENMNMLNNNFKTKDKCNLKKRPLVRIGCILWLVVEANFYGQKSL